MKHGIAQQPNEKSSSNAQAMNSMVLRASLAKNNIDFRERHSAREKLGDFRGQNLRISDILGN